MRWLCAVGAVGLGALSAQDTAGDWNGALKVNGAELRLLLHIARGEKATLKATLDSVDQGANGIPVTSITLTDSKLKLAADSINGSYEGTVNADATNIAGTWSQGGNSLPLEFHRGGIKTEHKAAKPSDIDGTWLGTLDLGAVKLRLVFHIVNTEDGLTATADSPDQNAKGLPVSQVTRDGSSLKLEMKALNAEFTGKISDDRKTISGTFTQNGNSTPLVLAPLKEDAKLERVRPQNPVKPYPYREEEVGYENTVQNVHLAATFTIPQGPGPFTAALLITGSGPQDRDESLLGHKPFLVLSDYLTRQGIAVLRADDRGIGKSTGNFGAATTADFATDVEAGIAYLKTRPEVNTKKIGLIGHSEGGVIAPMVAARNRDVAFIVMMAGTGVRGDEVLPVQVGAILKANGKSQEEVDKSAAAESEILALVQSEKDDTLVQKKLRGLLESKTPEAQITAQLKQMRSPWFQYFLTYDPAIALRKVTCPVLAINGAKDRQVIPDQNLPAIRKALQEGGNTHFEVVELPGLNHLFQTANTGAPIEYAEIDETIAPIALEKMASWILKQ